MQNDVDLHKAKTVEREALELLTVEKQKLEGDLERRRAKKRITDMDVQTRETEIENMKLRL